MPYPLHARYEDVLRSMDLASRGHPEPGLDYDRCAVLGITLRLTASILICSYVACGLAKANAALNAQIHKVLAAPTEGGLQQLVRRLADLLGAREEASFAVQLSRALRRKVDVSGVRNAHGALAELVSFRNDLIHGETIEPARAARAQALLRVTMKSLSVLQDWWLVVRLGSVGYRLDSVVPSRLPSEQVAAAWPDGQVMVAHRTDRERMLSLHPLLVFRTDVVDGDVTLDELFFLNLGRLTNPSYIAYRYPAAMGAQELACHDDLRAFMSRLPAASIAADPRIEFGDLARFHNRLFVGREDVTGRVLDFVDRRPTPYGVLTARAGIGKTAIVARLYHEAERGALDGSWVFHFCRQTAGHGEPIVALRSLTAQLCDAVDLPRRKWLSYELGELVRQRFPALLEEVAARMPAGRKLVVAIDALDEGIGASGSSVAASLPSSVPESVVFVLTYRAGRGGENDRVARGLAAAGIAPSRRTSLGRLDGLRRAEVEAFLSRVAQGRPVAAAEAVWRAAIRETLDVDSHGESPTADPFFLRLIADGVERGRIDLARPESVPASLDDSFEELWMSLPTDHDFLIHRLLCTLGVMWDFGDDDFFADLFNGERPAGSVRLLASDVARVRTAAGKLLLYDGDRYGLFHDRFRRFLVGERSDPLGNGAGV